MSSNNNPPRPREWWIIDAPIGDGVTLEKGTYLANTSAPTPELADAHPGKFIPVIERAAYEQVCKERDQAVAEVFEVKSCYEILSSMYDKDIKNYEQALTTAEADAKAMATALDEVAFVQHNYPDSLVAYKMVADSARAILTPERRERYGV